MKALRIFFLLSLVTFVANAAPEHYLKKDLQSDWKAYKQDQYVSFEETAGTASSLYFEIDARANREEYLKITSKNDLSVFINGKILGTGKLFFLKLDSLSKSGMGSKLSVALHGKRLTAEAVHTGLFTTTKTKTDADDRMMRSSSFRDFAITSFVIILLLLIVIIQLNPKLAADYFSITKIFSFRETEDSQAYTRITSSTNFLFYIFCSLMLGYYFMIVFHFVPERYSIAFSFQSKTFWGAMMQWLRLSGIILSACLAKIVLVYTLTFMFGVKELAGIHFFNWMRVILIFFGAITLIVSFYFIAHGQQLEFFSTLLKLLSWVLLGWMILIGLKLSRHMGRSLFHLFSYICATELIPFLITLKVLYN